MAVVKTNKQATTFYKYVYFCNGCLFTTTTRTNTVAIFTIMSEHSISSITTCSYFVDMFESLYSGQFVNTARGKSFQIHTKIFIFFQ